MDWDNKEFEANAVKPNFCDADGWKHYGNIPFEHSDTCPARHFRIITEEMSEEEKKEKVIYSENLVKLAVCGYVLDKNDNLMLTKRPKWLKIFPNRWVLPGGIVDFQEPLEFAIMREIEEEVGLTFEYTEENANCNTFHLTSPLRESQPNPIPITFEPYYVYESVTNNVLD